MSGRCRLGRNLGLAPFDIHEISEKLKAFLDYIMGIQSDDDYVKKLEAAVQKAKMNKKWRVLAEKKY